MSTLIVSGFFPWSSFSAPATLVDIALIRIFFSATVSGLYLFINLNKFCAVFLSRVFVNWLIAGGTLVVSHHVMHIPLNKSMDKCEYL